MKHTNNFFFHLWAINMIEKAKLRFIGVQFMAFIEFIAGLYHIFTFLSFIFWKFDDEFSASKFQVWWNIWHVTFLLWRLFIFPKLSMKKTTIPYIGPAQTRKFPEKGHVLECLAFMTDFPGIESHTKIISRYSRLFIFSLSTFRILAMDTNSLWIKLLILHQKHKRAIIM